MNLNDFLKLTGEHLLKKSMNRALYLLHKIDADTWANFVIGELKLEKHPRYDFFKLLYLA